MTLPGAPRAVSFRDPAGHLIDLEGRLFRVVAEHAIPATRALLESQFVADLAAARELVSARRLEIDEAAALGLGQHPLVLEHERIWFASYPHEWPAEMLHQAGALTLSIGRRALTAGMGLKDAHPGNLTFEGTRPVFLDWLSIEAREPRDPTWLADAQFQRTFLLPLLAHQAFGLEPASLLLTRRDGLSPREVYRMCGPLRRLLPSFLFLATLPTWLERRADGRPALYRPRQVGDPRQARFVLEHLLGRRTRQLARLEPSPAASTWSGYMIQRPSSYDPAQFAAKEQFVREVLEAARPASVLDVGCNTGHFSRLAARLGARVVAIDADSAVVGALWRTADAAGEDVLPLVVDFARPTPAVGWAEGEDASFLDRARGYFSAVLMLAILHHLLVTEGIPLERVLALLAALTTSLALIEWIAPDDPMFQQVARGRDELYRDLSAERFEAACRPWFQVVRKLTLPGGRRALYALRPLTAR